MVAREYPVLAEALLAAASAQLRTMATIGGNIPAAHPLPVLPRGDAAAVHQRVAGSGCAARDGDTRAQAIFGWTPECVATHPSDLAVALTALDATVAVRSGADGNRAVPMGEFYRQPGAVLG